MEYEDILGFSVLVAGGTEIVNVCKYHVHLPLKGVCLCMIFGHY